MVKFTEPIKMYLNIINKRRRCLPHPHLFSTNPQRIQIYFVTDSKQNIVALFILAVRFNKLQSMREQQQQQSQYWADERQWCCSR